MKNTQSTTEECLVVRGQLCNPFEDAVREQWSTNGNQDMRSTQNDRWSCARNCFQDLWCK